MNQDGTDYTVLHFEFEEPFGSVPTDGLLEGRESALYGTTQDSGTNLAGTHASGGG